MIYMDIYKEKYYVELTHRIMEAEKSQNLPKVGCRPREDGSVTQSKSEGLRTREISGVTRNLRVGENEMSQLKQLARK